MATTTKTRRTARTTRTRTSARANQAANKAEAQKFDLKTEATRTLYAGAGVADLAVAAVRDAVADVQKRFEDITKEAAARVDATQKTVVNLSPKVVVDQAAARVSELQAEAKAVPTKVQARIDDTTTTASKTYSELVERGETAVKKLRGDADFQATVGGAKETVAKAKTTGTQAKRAARSTSDSAKSTTRNTVRSAKQAAETAADAAESTARTAKKSAATTRKTAARKAAPAKSSAKATGTAVKKTATSATKAAEKAVETAGTNG